MDRSDTKAMQRQRLRAGRLLLNGHSQAEVARRVGAAPSTVCGWAKRVEAHGLEALRAKGPRGRPASLDTADRKRLGKILREGALAHGFATELWTVPRVRQVVMDEFGVALSESQMWRVLRAMGFSPQRPAPRAQQRDEAAVRQWKRKRWPALKKTPQNKDV